MPKKLYWNNTFYLSSNSKFLTKNYLSKVKKLTRKFTDGIFIHVSQSQEAKQLEEESSFEILENALNFDLKRIDELHFKAYKIHLEFIDKYEVKLYEINYLDAIERQIYYHFDALYGIVEVFEKIKDNDEKTLLHAPKKFSRFYTLFCSSNPKLKIVNAESLLLNFVDKIRKNSFFKKRKFKKQYQALTKNNTEKIDLADFDVILDGYGHISYLQAKEFYREFLLQGYKPLIATTNALKPNFKDEIGWTSSDFIQDFPFDTVYNEYQKLQRELDSFEKGKAKSCKASKFDFVVAEAIKDSISTEKVYEFLALHKLLNETKAKLIVTQSENFYSIKVLILLAKLKKIPTFNNFDAYHIDSTQTHHWKIRCDYAIFTGTKMVQDALKRNKVKSENQVINVGRPLYDKVHREKLGNRVYEAIEDDLGISKEAKCFVYASSNSTEFGQIFEKKITEKMLLESWSNVYGKNKDAALVIKLHPNDRATEVQDLIKKLSLENVVLIRKYNSYHLMERCDYWIVMSTTATAIEALMYNKRVILLDIWNRNYFEHLADISNTSRVSNKEDLIESLTSEIQNVDKNYQKILDDYFYILDGKSTSRVVTKIKQMAS